MKITGHKVTVVSVPYEGAITGSHVLLQLTLTKASRASATSAASGLLP